MKLILTYTLAAVTRNRYRTFAMLPGMMLAVGLLSAVLFYVDISAAHMTLAALATIPVDMQVVNLSPDTNLSDVESVLLNQPGITGGARFSIAAFTGGQIADSPLATATTPGALIAIAPDYLSRFASPKVIEGQFKADGLLISKDMATNLGVHPGDSITLHFADPALPFTAKISGIVDFAGADLLFAPIDPQPRAMAFNPPANVVMMDLATFNRTLRDALLAVPVTDTGTVVSAADAPVSEQIHLQLNHADLPADPIQAQTTTEQTRRLLERQFPGQIRVMNNMTDAIEQVKSDVLWARILVVFLAGPGILLAAWLSHYATVRLVAAQRRELALLRARGAAPSQVVLLLMAISCAIALMGVILGVMAGWLTVGMITGFSTLNAGTLSMQPGSALISAAVGLLLAVLTTVIPARALYLMEVRSAHRQLLAENHRPLWQRLYGDGLCLVAGCIVLIITRQNGFAPVLNGEGNATLSLSLLTFLAPVLIWIGAALLLTRLSGLLLRGGLPLTRRLLQKLFGSTGWFAGQGMSRRTAPLSQIILIIALAVAFGTSISGFAATYRGQQRVDAELTLGADVRVTPDRAASQTAAFADELRAVPGITAVSPFDMRVAYVGSELQDIFGIDTASLQQATTLSDAYFLTAPAQTVLSQLATTPDGIVVSEETAVDYSIVPGDHLNIRLQQADGRFVTVRFQMVGVAREFPTAPKDSFLVVNQAFLQQQTGSDTVSTFLVRAANHPGQAAAAIQARFGADLKLKIETIDATAARLASTLTTLSLDGLTAIQWLYTLLIAGLSLGIFLSGLLAERETEYATLAAVGATPAQVQSFIVSESLLASICGIVAGGLIGFIVTQVFVNVLTAIFDPPPTTMTLPVESIAALTTLVIISLVISSLVVLFRLRRMAAAQILRG